MSFFSKLERRLQPLAVPHVLLAIVAGQTFFYLAMLLGLVDADRLVLAWTLVAQGEWWRLTSFVLVPPAAHWAFIAFALYMLYFFGNTLEQEWGSLRLNLFLLTGWLLTLAAAWWVPDAVVGNAFVGASVFLAFAYLNPNYTLYLFFILPVQVKWLALVMWLSFAFMCVTGDAAERVLVLASTGNFLLFFGARIVRDLRAGKRQVGVKIQRRAAEREAEAAGPRHRCVVCAKNSDTHPNEDFRYRADEKCYCEGHLRAVIAQEGGRS